MPPARKPSSRTPTARKSTSSKVPTRNADQTAPNVTGPTGVTSGKPGRVDVRTQAGDFLTPHKVCACRHRPFAPSRRARSAGQRRHRRVREGGRGLGLPAPKGNPVHDVVLSPALSQVVPAPGPITGRKIGVIADAGSELAGIGKLRTAMDRLGAGVLVVAPVGGVLGRGARKIKVHVDRTLLTARSIEVDAVVVAGGTTPTNDIKLVLLLQEAFRHCKAMAAWGTVRHPPGRWHRTRWSRSPER